MVFRALEVLVCVCVCVCVCFFCGVLEVMHSIGVWIMLMEGGIAFMTEIKKAQSRGLINCMYIYQGWSYKISSPLSAR